ncbi:MAG: hypothetical protein A3E38_02330 [Candidatus Moranbacteria bacterium RIFCSPHIGHO2_12_FULL_54_9]|nr:MAG: hypothetical protein A2878_02815 [Candidatus Moranbacteria bacterium RIFCSPHIGHO2_01_FULL_54_31]OGI26067.1 MAG: hypothetical protein A3E38_02330 [Candidatus Moranbacteria bacterium RIFCSPHIGHO2_12_FULL_54_9]
MNLVQAAAKKLLPQPRQQPKPPKEVKKIEPKFASGDQVCFRRITKKGEEVYGIGKLVALESKATRNQEGKVKSFSYVADIQPLYETPLTWKLSATAGELSSDDPLAFPLATAAILLGRFRGGLGNGRGYFHIRAQLPEDTKRKQEILEDVSGSDFCEATYTAFLHFYCGEEAFSRKPPYI